MWQTVDDLRRLTSEGRSKRPVVIDGANILLSDSTRTGRILRVYYNALKSSDFDITVIVNRIDGVVRNCITDLNDVILVPPTPVKGTPTTEIPADGDSREHLAERYNIPLDSIADVPDDVIENVVDWMRRNRIRVYTGIGKRCVALDDIIAIFMAKLKGGVLISRDQFRDAARYDQTRTIRDFIRTRLLVPVVNEEDSFTLTSQNDDDYDHKIKTIVLFD